MAHVALSSIYRAGLEVSLLLTGMPAMCAACGDAGSGDRSIVQKKLLVLQLFYLQQVFKLHLWGAVHLREDIPFVVHQQLHCCGTLQ